MQLGGSAHQEPHEKIPHDLQYICIYKYNSRKEMTKQIQWLSNESRLGAGSVWRLHVIRGCWELYVLKINTKRI